MRPDTAGGEFFKAAKKHPVFSRISGGGLFGNGLYTETILSSFHSPKRRTAKSKNEPVILPLFIFSFFWNSQKLQFLGSVLHGISGDPAGISGCVFNRSLLI
jgi:hypothetical protein